MERFPQKKIGIIGFGNMGSAIADRIKSSYEVTVFDKDSGKTKGQIGMRVVKGVLELLSSSEIVLLAVKPQDFESVLKEAAKYLKDKLVISIAAGIKTSFIEKRSGNARVVRVMPNIGAKIGESVTCLCRGKFASSQDRDFANQLFYLLGETKEIEEGMMDAATAISGSGPGYIFDFLDANSIDPQAIPEHTKHDIMKRLERAAESVGFSREDATFLSVATTNSSIHLIAHTKIPAAQLRDQVASKGGTTEAGLKVLHKDGSWEEAAQAAKSRAEQLSQKE